MEPGISLSPRAKLAIYQMLDFNHLFALGRGTWGDLKSFSVANAQLLEDSNDSKFSRDRT